MTGKSKKQPPTQKTQPVKGEPVEIPVPKRKQVEQFMRDVAGTRKRNPPSSGRRR